MESNLSWNSSTLCIHADQMKNENYVVISLYLPVILLALIANLLVIVVVIKFHYMRNVTNYFLVNLSAADLLVTLVCMPIAILSAYTNLWLLGSIGCVLRNYLQCISVACSVFTITAMAVDRYLAITQPLGFCRWFTRKSTIVIIVLMWIVSMLFFSPLLFVAEHQLFAMPFCDKQKRYICVNNWSVVEKYLPGDVYGSISFSIMFAIPGLIILWAYFMMGKTLCSVRPPFDDNNSISTQQSFRLIRERKRVAWILLMLVLVFAFCWLPYNTITLLMDIDKLDIQTFGKYAQYLLLLGHVNSALNPIIYFAMSKNFRKSVSQMLCNPRDNFNGGRDHRLQRINTGPPIHIQVQFTLSRLQSSQKTSKTCAV